MDLDRSSTWTEDLDKEIVATVERTDLTFSDLGVIDPIVGRLAEGGFRHPFEIQAAVIPDALAGRDVLGKAKTGSGKTLAFGVPLVQRMREGVPGTQALVLVPTRELCSQVADELRLFSPPSARILAAYGGADLRRHMREGPGAHMIVATPGRLIDLIERKKAKLGGVHMLVIDEADRMADMGFLPQVAAILRHVPRDRQTMLFSATLDHQVHGLMAQTRDPVRCEVTDEIPTVEGVEHHFFLVHPLDKVEVLKAILEAPRDLTLVFTRTKRGCDRLERDLRGQGVKATAIHGDLAQRAREKALTHFETGGADVLVATDVAARGLDIDNITQIVNYDPPEDPKAYLHRVGRTARAGKTGVGITLATFEQRDTVERVARILHLETAVEEVYSTDPRLRKVGTGELEGARPIEAPVEASVEAGAYAKYASRRRRRR